MTLPPALIAQQVLGFQWPTIDPFLFCAHHKDLYPAGNAQLGLDPEHLQGRPIGQDFQPKDGFRMYHGQGIPGFPAHPHSGFETITIALEGFIDHSDSLGAAARFGEGDVQWMTAGRGIQHSEMFPLLNAGGKNSLELFQIWLNLPDSERTAEPHFQMMWAHEVPIVAGQGHRIRLIAGEWKDAQAPTPPPASWASDPRSAIALWHIEMDANTSIELPVAADGADRQLYLHEGDELMINGQRLKGGNCGQLNAQVKTQVETTNSATRFLVMQGRPIGESTAQHGPFVAADRKGLMDAFQSYERGEFGQWPWPDGQPVHDASLGRFARYPDGKEIHP